MSLEDLRSGLVGYLRAIAHRRLLPEAVVRFAGRPQIIRRLMSYPISEQQDVLDAPVSVLDADGRAVERDPLAMSAGELSLAFAPDHVRSIPEQQAARRPKSPPGAIPESEPFSPREASAPTGMPSQAGFGRSLHP